jgi:hypothetical protein
LLIILLDGSVAGVRVQVVSGAAVEALLLVVGDVALVIVALHVAWVRFGDLGMSTLATLSLARV